MELSQDEVDNFWKLAISQTLTGGYNGKKSPILSRYSDDEREILRPEETSILHRSLGKLKFIQRLLISMVNVNKIN